MRISPAVCCCEVVDDVPPIRSASASDAGVLLGALSHPESKSLPDPPAVFDCDGDDDGG